MLVSGVGLTEVGDQVGWNTGTAVVTEQVGCEGLVAETKAGVSEKQVAHGSGPISGGLLSCMLWC